MPVNVELLKKVRENILDEPEHFDMENWISVTYEGEDFEACGTTCCIAGRAHVIDCLERGVTDSQRQKDTFEYGTGCMRLLGYESWEEYKSLIYNDHWPMPWFDQFRKAPNKYERAKVAADYLGHLIKEHS
jgi:hypothetical protein